MAKTPPVNVAALKASLGPSIVQRAPTPADDASFGHIADGSIGRIAVTGGSGYVAPTLTMGGASAPLYGTLMATVSAGAITAVIEDGTTRGCLTNPTVTITDSAGTGATVAAYARPGSLWRSGDKRIFRNLQNNLGNAAWAEVLGAYGLPGDLVTGARGIYGNRAMVTAWANGNWIDVSATAGGTATTIKFINGQPDIAGLAAVIGAGLGYVSKLYDQSGNAYDATQTTAANQPVIRLDITIGGVPAIVFDSVIDGGSPVSKFLTLPSGLTLTGGAITALGVFRATSARRAAYYWTFANASNAHAFGSESFGKFAHLTVANISTFGNTAPTLTPAVIGFNEGSGVTHTFWNNYVGTHPGCPGTALAGGTIGGFNEFGGLIVYPTSRSLSATMLLRASLANLFDVYPQAQDVIVFGDDSITQGYGGTALQHYARKALAFLPASARVYNAAQYGATVSQRITDYPGYVAILYNAAAKNNVLSIWVGTNDIVGSSATGTATYALLTQYISMAKATGFKVNVVTMLRRTDCTGSKETERQSYNALIRANSGGTYGTAGRWDAITDLDADPLWGTVGSLFYDGIHPLDAGYSYIAPAIAKGVASLLQ